LQTISKSTGNVKILKTFLERIWESNPLDLSPTLLDDILDDILSKIVSKRADYDEISLVLKDTRQIMSSLSLGVDGGIFANGKYLEKDSVIIIFS